MSLIPGGTATVSGTFSGGAPTGLSETVDGVSVPVLNPVITIASGNGPTAAGTFSFQFVVPAAGLHAIHVAGAGTYKAAVDFLPPAPPSVDLLLLVQPALSRIYQRDTRTGGAFGKGAGAVGFSVNLSGPVETLDYRLRDADAAGNPVRQDWTALASAEQAGTAALTPVGTNPPTGMALNGSGALLLPSQTYAYAQLRGLGIQGDGTFEIDAAGGPQPLDIVVFLHASTDNSTSTALLFQGEYGHVGVYVPGVSNATVLPTPATFTKVRVTSAGTAVTIVVDGATVGTVTITSGATGYVGIGSSSTASPQVAISQVSFG